MGQGTTTGRRWRLLERTTLVALFGLMGKAAAVDVTGAAAAPKADVEALPLPPQLHLDLPAVQRMLETVRAERRRQDVLQVDEGGAAPFVPAFEHLLADRLAVDGGIDVVPGASTQVPSGRLGLTAAPADRFTLSATMTWLPIGTRDPLTTSGETTTGEDAMPERLRAALGDPFRLSPSDHQLDLSASWTPTDSLAFVLDYAAATSRIPEAGSLHLRSLGGTLGWWFSDRTALNLGASVLELGGTALGGTFRVWDVTASGTFVLGGGLQTVVAVTRDSLAGTALFVGLQYHGR